MFQFSRIWDHKVVYYIFYLKKKHIEFLQGEMYVPSLQKSDKYRIQSKDLTLAIA